ncbi:hypothetical protein GEMRC1_010759 [Eukaryota sp. GEM-RC1]
MSWGNFKAKHTPRLTTPEARKSEVTQYLKLALRDGNVQVKKEFVFHLENLHKIDLISSVDVRDGYIDYLVSTPKVFYGAGPSRIAWMIEMSSLLNPSLIKRSYPT